MKTIQEILDNVMEELYTKEHDETYPGDCEEHGKKIWNGSDWICFKCTATKKEINNGG